MVPATEILRLVMMLLALAVLSVAQAATPLDDLGFHACEEPGTTEMMELRTALFRARVDLPLTALAVAERNGAGLIVRMSYLPLGVAFLDKADPRLAPTRFRIDHTTSLQTLSLSGERRFLMFVERRRRIVDFALVNFDDLEPTKLRLSFFLPGRVFRVRSIAVCVVELSVWSGDEYLPKAR